MTGSTCGLVGEGPFGVRDSRFELKRLLELGGGCWAGEPEPVQEADEAGHADRQALQAGSAGQAATVQGG